MIKHVVLFNLKDEAESGSKDENIQQILRNVQRLRDEVPVKKTIEASQKLKRDRDAPWAADLAVVAEFDSLEDYDAYVADAIHQQCVAFAASVSTHVEAITYECSTVTV